MKTFLHIGQHKTGSTSFQAAISHHRDALRADGVYVPIGLGPASGTNHYALNIVCLAANRYSYSKVRFLTTGGDQRDQIDCLARDVADDIAQHYAAALDSGCDRIIWSNEGLFLLNSVSEYLRLRELFSPHSSEVTPIWVRRNADNYLESHKRELSQKQGTVDLRLVYDTLSGGWLTDYVGKERLLKEVFGRFVSVNYEEHSDIVSPMFDLLGSARPAEGQFFFNLSKNS